MRINRDNYEVYFIDYIDGNLAADLVGEFELFLANNPDLKLELDGLDAVHLQDQVLEKDWSTLKKTDFDQPDIFEESCLRYIENDSSEKERADFTHYLKLHPEKWGELNLFQATISEPDFSIGFKNKEQLQKKVFRLSPIWYSAAAVVVLAMVLWFLPKPDISSNTIVADAVQVIHVELAQPDLNLDAKTTTAFEKLVEPVQQKEEPALIEEREVIQLEMMASITDVDVEEPIENTIARYIPINFYYTSSPGEAFEEAYAEYLAEQKSKNFLRNVGRGSLNALRNVTNKKFDYQTYDNGQLASIEYNSRILAFNIPVNQEQN